jgi:hypothetical protein
MKKNHKANVYQKNRNKYAFTADGRIIYENNFDKDGFKVINISNDLMIFWTKDNIKRLEPFVKQEIFNKCNNNDVTCFKLQNDESFRNDGKRKQGYLFNKKSCSPNFRLNSNPVDRLQFYTKNFFTDKKDEDLAIELIKIEQFVCDHLKIPLDYFVQSTILLSLAGFCYFYLYVKSLI